MAYRVRYNNKHHRNNPVISKLNVVEVDTATFDTATFDAEFEAFSEEQKRIKSEREAKKHRHKKKTE